MTAQPPLTNLQLELLKLFQYQLEERQLLDIKELISQYMAAELDRNMDALFEAKGWGKEKIEEWGAAHLRTPYKP